VGVWVWIGKGMNGKERALLPSKDFERGVGDTD
jgi:hypothetical protein